MGRKMKNTKLHADAEPREIAEATSDLLSWMTNTSREHNAGVLRLIASFPFAGELQDAGYEPSVPSMGWMEFQKIQKVMEAIETKDDVEFLVGKILREGD